MYLNHFNFNTLPFQRVTRPAGAFFVDYHQDVYTLLEEKTRIPGLVGLFSDDETLLKQFTDKLSAGHATTLTVNAFPKLSAETLLYKLNPTAQQAALPVHVIDASLEQWRARATAKKPGALIILNTLHAMRDGCWKILGMLLARAEELSFPLTILLTGAPNQLARIVSVPGLNQRLHTRHLLRPLSRAESREYLQRQLTEHGAGSAPFSAGRGRKLYAMTRGNITRLNKLAHLALLAAWTERAPQVSARHLRLAASEVLPSRLALKKLATLGLLSAVVCAAVGWRLPASQQAWLPFTLPVPASWHRPAPQAAPPAPSIDNEVVNFADAMHQLYKMWGYEASGDDTLCQNASRVGLMCKQGSAPLAELEKEGYPWIGEIRDGGHLNYVVIARADNTSLDLLLNDRTWQVTHDWFVTHATGNYTLLHRLTPDGHDNISAASSARDIAWLDTQLGQALKRPPTHSSAWTSSLVQRIRDFQHRVGIHADGIPGEDTLIYLMRATNMTPAIATDVQPAERDIATQQGKTS
ncbi:ExeA family protein [Entomohabitans teleogrylli]|uniref:ExeA family protein n=1 Tax=Entomohabitans teleogrylli TaxID=1384589 RepID=UPI00073D7785|nr:ExeA family protein [Entomohabitans teleogrylli]